MPTAPICPYCGSIAQMQKASFVYSRNLNDYGYLWVCENFPKCDAYVGTHQGTLEPLGRLANGRLRRLKVKAHAVFDPLWCGGKNSAKKRKASYRWLAKQLGLSKDECHIGMFDEEMCKKVIAACQQKGIVIR